MTFRSTRSCAGRSTGTSTKSSAMAVDLRITNALSNVAELSLLSPLLRQQLNEQPADHRARLKSLLLPRNRVVPVRQRNAARRLVCETPRRRRELVEVA